MRAAESPPEAAFASQSPSPLLSTVDGERGREPGQSCHKNWELLYCLLKKGPRSLRREGKQARIFFFEKQAGALPNHIRRRSRGSNKAS